MNIKKGLIRVFLLLSLVAFVFCFLYGMQFAKMHWSVSAKKVYSNISWNAEKIDEYYNYAKRCVSSKDENSNTPWKDIYSCNIKESELPEYKKNPPEYNECLVSAVFLNRLTTPTYKIILGGVLGGITGFIVCFAGLYTLFLIFSWVINGFKD